MTVLETLRALAKGATPEKGLLHNCRFEGLGVEAYGIEAIVERLRMAPFKLSADMHIVETANHIALFDGARSIFADMFDGHVARLWVLGSDRLGHGEPTLSVPFDPDLSQDGGDVFFATGDHPGLAPDAAHHVTTAGRQIVAETQGRRTRAFAVRAFGSAESGAALFTLFRLGHNRGDVAGFTLAAARWSEVESDIVRDFGGEETLASDAWTPRIGI